MTAADAKRKRDSVGGETVGGVELARARQLARENAVEAVRVTAKIMREPGRGALARLKAAEAILRFASESDADAVAAEGDAADLTPADVELMRRFLEERTAKPDT